VEQQLQNENVKKVITELLENSKRLDSSDIVVDVKDGDVTLSGSVKDEFQKQQAEAVIETVQEVRSIYNELIVKTNPGILPTDIGRQH
jgi:osmotically-inducible protein OsmY